MSGLEILLAVVIAFGLIGVLVPLMPGSLLVGATVLFWAVTEGNGTGWTVLGVVAALLAVGWVVKYLIPGRRLQASGVPNRTLLLGAAVALVGFFVIPVIGLAIGFVLGIYLAELRRTSSAEAWPATVAALKAIGLGILIELSFATVAAAVWLVGALTT